MNKRISLKKRLIINLIKMLVTSLIVFGLIWEFTEWLKDIAGSQFSFFVNVLLNVAAVVTLTHYNKTISQRENIKYLKQFNSDFILDPLELIIKMYTLKTPGSSGEFLINNLDHIADRIDIIRNNTGYENNIDFFYLIKKANELHPASETFIQDIEDFKQLVRKEFETE